MEQKREEENESVLNAMIFVEAVILLPLWGPIWIGYKIAEKVDKKLTIKKQK